MAAWLDLVPETTGWSLVDTGRLERLVEELGHPATQYPSLIWFAGNGNRIKALQALFPHNNITRRGPTGLAQLHISTETAGTENPVLFAETDLFNICGERKTNISDLSRERIQRYHIAQDGSRSTADTRRHVITNILFAFTHVLCFFVDTPSEMQEVVEMVESPHHKFKIGSRSAPDFTRVIIVLTYSEMSEAHDTMLKELVHFPNANIQLQVHILDLRNRHILSSKAAFEPLRRVVLDQVQSSRTELIEHGLSFSSLQLCTFWNRTIELKMGSSEDLALNCLKVARESHKMNVVTMEHLESFLSHASDLGCAIEDTHTFVASALLMNAYPPGMHLFRHEDIFEYLYNDQCRKAWSTHTGLDPTDDCNSVLAHMGRFSRELSPTRSPSSIRRAALNKFYYKRKGLYSTTSCFVCLCRPPEHMLPCHHAICDICVVIFGLPSKTAEYHFDIHHCPVCSESFQVVIRQLPPTKSPVVFSLDGGGVRGMIQLGLLQSLEKRLGNEISLSQIVDLFTCTSAGALNGMDMVFNESTAEQSFQKFPGFARKVFKARPNLLQGIASTKCTRWLKCFLGLLADSQYDGENLDNVLKDGLSSNRRLFDFGSNSGSSSRIAIIASRTSDGKACVMANYRGVSPRPVEGAYLFLRPQDRSQDPFLWEAARCSVAAPWFFRTKTVPGFGPLQDGGVRANNPISIALRESSVIWPAARRHDLLISVGTGFTPLKEGNGGCSTGNIFKDGAVPRLFRAAMSSPAMDGEQGFYEALNYISDNMREDIHRLNHPITCPLPRLDDVDVLGELEKSTYIVPDNIVRAVLVTGCFFFELDQTPVSRNGSYLCQGSILCRSSQPRILLKQVVGEFPGGQFQTARGHPIGLLEEDDGCYDCGYYRKKVAFLVKSLEEMVTIELVSSSSRQKVGGFPKCMQEMLDDQQAFARFGRPDHLISSWPPRRKCFCLRGTRRLVQFIEPPLSKKKRRL